MSDTRLQDSDVGKFYDLVELRRTHPKSVDEFITTSMHKQLAELDKKDEKKRASEKKQPKTEEERSRFLGPKKVLFLELAALKQGQQVIYRGKDGNDMTAERNMTLGQPYTLIRNPQIYDTNGHLVFSIKINENNQRLIPWNFVSPYNPS